MDRNKIQRLIEKSEEIARRRKLKRNLYTILFYTAVNLQVFYWQGQLGRSISDILGAVLLSAIISVAAFILNVIIFDQLFRLDQEDKAKQEMFRNQLEKYQKE